MFPHQLRVSSVSLKLATTCSHTSAVGSFRFIRHYCRNPGWFLVLCVVICLNSARSPASHGGFVQRGLSIPVRRFPLTPFCPSASYPFSFQACSSSIEIDFDISLFLSPSLYTTRPSKSSAPLLHASTIVHRVHTHYHNNSTSSISPPMDTDPAFPLGAVCIRPVHHSQCAVHMAFSQFAAVFLVERTKISMIKNLFIIYLSIHPFISLRTNIHQPPSRFSTMHPRVKPSITQSINK